MACFGLEVVDEFVAVVVVFVVVVAEPVAAARLTELVVVETSVLDSAAAKINFEKEHQI